jgi:hypothetical protein
VAAAQPAGDVATGLDEPNGGRGSGLAGDGRGSRRLLERVIAEGESPVGHTARVTVIRDREYRRTRDIRREAGTPTSQG